MEISKKLIYWKKSISNLKSFRLSRKINLTSIHLLNIGKRYLGLYVLVLTCTSMTVRTSRLFPFRLILTSGELFSVFRKMRGNEVRRIQWIFLVDFQKNGNMCFPVQYYPRSCNPWKLINRNSFLILSSIFSRKLFPQKP